MQLKNNYTGFIIFFLIGLQFISCQNRENANDNGEDQSSESQIDESEAQLPEDFLIFYDQFHSDESFQLDHITWPLRGLPDQVDSEQAMEDDFFYQREDWVMHHKFNDPDDLFEQYFAIVDEKLIIEKIEMKTTNLSMERRFAKMNDQWHLIYYVGMNPMKR